MAVIDNRDDAVALGGSGTDVRKHRGTREANGNSSDKAGRKDRGVKPGSHLEFSSRLFRQLPDQRWALRYSSRLRRPRIFGRCRTATRFTLPMWDLRPPFAVRAVTCPAS